MRVIWKLGLGLGVGLLCVWGMGCQPRSADRYLPYGWSMESGSAQLLARSYPSFDWMTLILPPGPRPRRLFTAPMVPLVREEASRERPSLMPRLPWQSAPSRKMRQNQGFEMSFRTNRAVSLVCKLRVLQKDRSVRIVEYHFVLPRSPRRWMKKRFLWADFRELQGISAIQQGASSRPTSHHTTKATTKPAASLPTSVRTASTRAATKQFSSPHREAPPQARRKKRPSHPSFSPLSLTGGIEFWESHGHPRKRSVTLTLRGPFAISGKPRRSKRSL
ncbi:MAG: hypothetical protein H6728_03085 [Myxococcales bacterium]|nr:hypothetical protein [Myxococcales bacterium]